jgi:hypothetical protein
MDRTRLIVIVSKYLYVREYVEDDKHNEILQLTGTIILPTRCR